MRESAAGTASGRARRDAFLVQAGEGAVRGPLGREAVFDQLCRGALGPDDLVCRDGGPWAPLAEHPDFRLAFVPGTADAARVAAFRERDGADRRAFAARRAARVAAAVAFMVAALGGSFAAWKSGAFVVSEEVVGKVGSAVGGGARTVQTLTEQAMNADAAVSAAKAARALPGDDVVAAIAARHPGLGGHTGLHTVLAWKGLWAGTPDALADALVNAEKAVALAPKDPEALAVFALLAADAAERRPELAGEAVLAAERAEALSPGAPAVRRARAAAARAGGLAAQAAEILGPCGDAAALGRGADPGCVLDLARLRGDAGALAALDAFWPEVWPVLVARAEVAFAAGDTASAVRIAAPLAKKRPEDPRPWRVLLHAHASLGNWKDATAAAQRLARLDPGGLRDRIAMAEIRFEVLGRAKEALGEYTEIMAEPGFARLEPEVRASALADAAAAALATGDLVLALTHADGARALAGGHPPANLVRARVLAAQGEAEPAEVALRDADLTPLTPHARARFQVGAARVLAAVGRHRAAVIEAEAATESDPDWPEGWLEAGRARLEVGNLEGALDAVEAAAFRMRARESDRSARQRVVLPPTDWSGFRRALGQALSGDLRYGARGTAGPELVGFVVGASDALPRLARLVDSTQDAPPAARVALAQAALERRAWAEAGVHARATLATGRDLAFARAIQGVAAAEAGQADEADSLLRQALQAAPQDPAIRRLHARARQRAGDRAGARAAWEEVLRLAPDDLGARRALVALDAG